MSNRSRRYKRQPKETPPPWFEKIVANLKAKGIKITEWPSTSSEVPTHIMSEEYGAIVDALMSRDRAYFEEHPDETVFVRPAEFGDMLEGETLDPSLQWFVEVTQIEPGIRMRSLFVVADTPQRTAYRN